MHCRRANATDASALHQLRYRSILELAPVGMPLELARQWAERGSVDRILQRLQESDVWIAEVGDRIVGWAAVRGDDYLDALYVDPSLARQGIGTSLLEFIEEMLRRRSVAVIRADVSWNAEGFYRNRGYEPVGPRPADDAWPMRKRLLPIAD